MSSRQHVLPLNVVDYIYEQAYISFYYCFFFVSCGARLVLACNQVQSLCIGYIARTFFLIVRV